MAGALTHAPRQRAPGAFPRRVALPLTALVLLGHALALLVFSRLLQPPSLLQAVAPPFYTRTLAPAAEVAALPNPSKPNQPQIKRVQAQNARKIIANQKPAPPKPEAADSGMAAPIEVATPEPEPPIADAAVPPEPAASAPERVAEPSDSPASSPASAALAAAGGTGSTTAADTTHLDGWPADTRLNYRLSGNYRGELHGDAQVLWQRSGTRYQTAVQLDVGFLLSTRFTSQGEITPQGLKPEVYEEQVRGKRRGVRLDPDGVRLNNGERVPRPQDVQDTASQFVELGHRFATGEIKLAPGGQVNFWLARPGGVDEWTYDVVGEETIHLPRLGPVQAMHLKPRPLTKPRGPIMAEMWFAPSLQYLPVRIRLTSGPDTHLDLLVETIEQK